MKQTESQDNAGKSQSSELPSNTPFSDESEPSHQSLVRKCKTYESWLRAIDEFADFDVWFKDLEGRYQFVNQRFEKVIGLQREKLLNTLPRDLFDLERAQRIAAMDRKVIDDGGLKRIIPCDETGKLEMHDERRFPIRDEDGQIIGLGCFAFEVTDYSIAEEALNQAQTLAKLGNWRWSIRDNCLISCSEQFANLLGCEDIGQAFHLMHDRLTRIVHPDDRHIVKPHAHGSNSNNPPYQIEYRIVRADGEIRHVLEIAEPLLGNTGVAVEYAGTLQDITEQKIIEEELRLLTKLLEKRVEERTKHLEFLANHDSLTGLLNRNAIRHQTEHLIVSGEANSAVVVVIDLDGFKNVNDCFGHSTGDIVLKIVAERIQKTLPPQHLAARFGGDEFALALFDLNNPIPQALAIFKQIEKAIKQKISVGNLEFLIGSSAGIYSPETEFVFDEAMKYGDIALYKAKESQHRSAIVFEEYMAEEVAYHRQLETDLRIALTEKTLFVAYQPIIDIVEESVAGFEALARWTHPEFGPIPPDTFIAIAEDCGLINELSELILHTTCKDYPALSSLAVENFRISVNFSASQFYNPLLVTTFTDILKKSSIRPEAFEIEVTESLFIKNLENTKQLLDQFRAMGVSIALDDFGKGYSALAYLNQFNIDRIKLDRSFVSHIGENLSSKRIVEGIVNLANSLNLNVTGEGVETQEQWDYLSSVGCHKAQGYFMGKPKPLSQLIGSIKDS